jgi:Na+:H+ antiporter
MPTRGKRILLFLAAALLLPQLAMAAGGSDSFTRTTLLLILLITLADACGFLFERLGLPEILGEISAGVILGNLHLIGINYNISAALRGSEFMQYSSELGVVLLLFLVGLETNAQKLMRVGRDAALVAVSGVLLPVITGVAAATVLGFGNGIQEWFVGAMLAATSVGITAKYLDEKKKLQTRTAQVILGAAVIDDVIAILLLAVLASIAITGDVALNDLLWIVIKAVLFFVGAVALGRFVLPEMVHLASLRKHASVWTGFALCLALSGAQLASWAGLAPLIGAFVAGLLLDDVHFVLEKKMSKHRLEVMLRPISDVLLSIFFVGIGSQVQLETLADPRAVVLIAALLIIALLSKGLAGYASRRSGVDRLGIGIGMIPRGEVGLVFAAFALSHQIFDADTYSALVIVILLTTMAGPLLLKHRLRYF